MKIIKLYVWLGMAVVLLLLCINIPAYLIVYGEMKNISNTALRSAKAEGGFFTRTQQLIEEQVSGSRLEADRLEITVYPGMNEPVQKRDTLEVRLKYRFPYNMVVYGYAEKKDLIMNVNTSGVSLKYFK